MWRWYACLRSSFACIYYLLGKGGYVFGSIGLLPPWEGGYVLGLSVCLSVCLVVDNITQKVMNGLG